jgi:molybdopterin-synthase adenylyltransferase
MDYSAEVEKSDLFGKDGVEHLREKTAGLVGLGALGSISAQLLSRFPLKKLVLVDRDIVESKNMFRQFLYTPEDAERVLPKARAAAMRLQPVSQPVIEARDIHLGPGQAKELFEECDIVVDATDNFETRFLLNDCSVHYGKPWIYGGVLASQGSMLFIDPGDGPCLRCAFEELPAVGAESSCETAGIHPSLPLIVSSLQVSEAAKYLSGRGDMIERDLINVNLDELRFTKMEFEKNPSCSCCVEKELSFLDEGDEDKIMELCGSGSVMIVLKKRRIELKEIVGRLEKEGSVFTNPFLVQLKKDEATITVHADGRILVHGINEGKKAMSLVSRILGL